MKINIQNFWYFIIMKVSLYVNNHDEAPAYIIMLLQAFSEYKQIIVVHISTIGRVV